MKCRALPVPSDAEAPHHGQRQVDVGAADQVGHPQGQRGAQQRRGEQRGDELTRDVARQAQPTAAETAPRQRHRQALGRHGLDAGAERLEGAQQRAHRAAPELRRAVEGVDAVRGGAGGEQEARRGAGVATVDRGLGGGQAAGRALDGEAAGRLPLDTDAERAQAVDERRSVVGLERVEHDGVAPRQGGEQQSAVGDALRARQAHDDVEVGAGGADRSCRHDAGDDTSGGRRRAVVDRPPAAVFRGQRPVTYSATAEISASFSDSSKPGMPPPPLRTAAPRCRQGRPRRGCPGRYRPSRPRCGSRRTAPAKTAAAVGISGRGGRRRGRRRWGRRLDRAAVLLFPAGHDRQTTRRPGAGRGAAQLPFMRLLSSGARSYVPRQVSGHATVECRRGTTSGKECDAGSAAGRRATASGREAMRDAAATGRRAVAWLRSPARRRRRVATRRRVARRRRATSRC